MYATVALADGDDPVRDTLHGLHFSIGAVSVRHAGQQIRPPPHVHGDARHLPLRSGLLGLQLERHVHHVRSDHLGYRPGDELPVVSSLVQERAPKKPPGKVIGLLVSTWAVGCMLAVVMAFSAPLRIDWRDTFFISRSPVLYGIAIRLYISESPKWLASVDRYDEAVAIVESIERAHGLEPNNPKTKLETGDTAAVAGAPRMTESHIKHIVMLFQHQFRVRTSVLWAL